MTLQIVPPGNALPGNADLVILPGSKTTLADLAHFRAQGWDVDLAAHLRRGGAVLGICAGFQMLGRRIADPDGTEGKPGAEDGLGYLDLETELSGDKALTQVEGEAFGGLGVLTGYEMHVGRTTGSMRPFLTVEGAPRGCVSADEQVMGCYLHGLFAADGFRHAFLERLRARAVSGVRYEAEVDAALDGLADALEDALNVDAMIDAAA